MIDKIKTWLKTIDLKTWVLIILGLFLIAGIVQRYFKSISDAKKVLSYENIISAQNDTISRYKDKLGREVAKIQSFEQASLKDFLKINFQDSTIQKLQKELSLQKKKNVQYLAVIETYTKIDTTAKVIYIPTEVPTQPIYTYRYSDDWITLNDTVSHIQSKFKLEVYNDFVVNSHRQKNTLITEVTNNNPYTITTGIRSFSTSLPKQKKFGLGIQGGWNPWSGWYAGIGAQYTIIHLW